MMYTENGRRRVVVTGLGAITPLGLSADEFWGNLVAGVSGIGPMTLCDPTDYPCRIAGQADDFDATNYIDRREARRMARFSQLAVAAALQAVTDAGLDMAQEDPYRVGVLLGNGNGRLSHAGGKLPDPGRPGRDAYVALLLPHDPAQHGGRPTSANTWARAGTTPPQPRPARRPTTPSARRCKPSATALPTPWSPAARRPASANLGWPASP